jgi:glyoxylase-like metal-dependent hydrolase (beta-lactamase superfamily II)
MRHWEIIERPAMWQVRRNGQLVQAGQAEFVWAYVARHARDEETVTVRYVSGREGPELTGAALRALLTPGKTPDATSVRLPSTGA